MVSVGLGIYVLVPGRSDRKILHPAKIVQIAGDVFTAELESDEIDIEPGQDIFVYYEVNREFMQQTARIDALKPIEAPADPKAGATPNPETARVLFGFQTTSEAISAENRQCYRVSTIFAEIFATVGEEEKCQVLDISSSGFSVRASTRYALGQMLGATLRHDGNEFSGQASVQSIKELDDGSIRYGLHTVVDRKLGGNLLKGQQQISMAMQRQQLRRISGSA